MLGFLNWVYVGAGALAAFALFSLYDGLIDDPLVRREAINGYVLKSERDAVASQLAEERRRALAAAQAAEEFRKRYAALSESSRAISERAEKAIADDTSDDGARVSAGDIEWLSNHR